MASRKLEVEAVVPGDGTHPARGVLSFIDNTVSASTGTIQLKATFTNGDATLWPGQFVNAVLALDSRQGALVLPSQTVQSGQEGQYVYIVKADSTVEYRPVKVVMDLGKDVVVGEGVARGEKAVADGQLRLSPGARVRVIENGARAEGDGAESDKGAGNKPGGAGSTGKDSEKSGEAVRR